MLFKMFDGNNVNDIIQIIFNHTEFFRFSKFQTKSHQIDLDRQVVLGLLLLFALRRFRRFRRLRRRRSGHYGGGGVDGFVSRCGRLVRRLFRQQLLRLFAGRRLFGTVGGRLLRCSAFLAGWGALTLALGLRAAAVGRLVASLGIRFWDGMNMVKNMRIEILYY